MFSFHSKYFVYRELKRAPQKLSFCFKCPDTGTVRILGNILYRLDSDLSGGKRYPTFEQRGPCCSKHSQSSMYINPLFFNQLPYKN